MNYKKIKDTITEIESSDKQYYEYPNVLAMLKEFDYKDPDDVALEVFEVAHKYGGKEVLPLLRRLELQELGMNCHGPTYWLDVLEAKYAS